MHHRHDTTDTLPLQAARFRADHLREPLAIDGLLSEDQRRLAHALASSKPLPASNAEECRELLERPRRIEAEGGGRKP
jgi:hypothetical protein